ncbi:MAG: protein kinase [Clostridia bacterium]|nr:protein kinase [Clostridia bacterium]
MGNHENLIGRILGGRYKIKSIVGEGGMSVVTLAEDLQTNTDVTVKLLSLHDDKEQNASQRFINEAKAVSMLSHPNIVSVYGVSLEGEEKYIVMEYINGITLKEYLDKKTRLEWREAVHYVNQVLSALSHAHSKGIIHRDIKPENVMLMRDGSIKVIDFGIAKLPDAKSLTVIDKAIGTVNYISPEQASGSGSTEKSDIYSTGIMLYELVTGQLPFVSSSSVAVAMMHVSSEPASPTSLCDSIPRGLEQTIIKAMMKSPERRFGTALAMHKALEYLLAHPETVFKDSVVLGADGKPITGTGASASNGNNTVIGPGISGAHTKVPSYDDDAEKPDDDDDDEYSYVKPAKPSMLAIILGVTLAFFTVLVLFTFFAWNRFGDIFVSETPRDSAADTIVVPNLEDAEFTDALLASLIETGFDVEVNYTVSTEVEPHRIISQEPLAESTRKKNADGVKLVLYVSRSTSQIILPDYKHYEKENAKLDLETKGLRTKYEYKNSESVIRNHVISTSPEKGSAVFEGDTVTIIVSGGPSDVKAKIPKSVVGMPHDAAVKLLTNLDINSERCSEAEEEFSETVAQGCVIRTVPAAGTEVSVINDSVKLIISKGKEPVPEVEQPAPLPEEVQTPSEPEAVIPEPSTEATPPAESGNEPAGTPSAEQAPVITETPAEATPEVVPEAPSEAVTDTAVVPEPVPEVTATPEVTETSAEAVVQ